MDPVKLAESIVLLYNTFGEWPAVIFGVLFLLSPLIITIYRDRSARKTYEQLIDSKEDQIQRIAAENREWRNLFFRDRGLTDKEILGLQDNTHSPPSPIKTKPPPKQRKKRR